MPNEEKTVAYVVRHGETELNADGRFRGDLDPHLDEHGLADADELSGILRNVDLGEAWTSDKTRAEQTAERILEPKGMSASPTKDLRAWNVGYLSGEKKNQHQDDVAYFQRNPNLPIPGGESLNEFRNRVRPQLLQAIKAGLDNGSPSLVVAHSSVIHELGNLIHSDHNAALVEPGGMAAVTYDGKYFRAKAVHKPDTVGEKKYAT